LVIFHIIQSYIYLAPQRSVSTQKEPTVTKGRTIRADPTARRVGLQGHMGQPDGRRGRPLTRPCHRSPVTAGGHWWVGPTRRGPLGRLVWRGLN